MTEQTSNETAAEIDRYVSTWIRVLTTVRGCSIQDARRWAEPLLRGHLELTLHEPAAYWVAPALAPAEFTVTLDPESLVQLHGSLQFALDQGDSFWKPRSDEELQQMRPRIHAVLNDYRKQLAPNAVADILQTDFPRTEGLELGVRVVMRHLRNATLTDPVRNVEFGRHERVPFAKASRLVVRGPEGEAHLWWDAFGFNLVIDGLQPEPGRELLEAVRFAFVVNNYRGGAPVQKAAA